MGNRSRAALCVVLLLAMPVAADTLEEDLEWYLRIGTSAWRQRLEAHGPAAFHVVLRGIDKTKVPHLRRGLASVLLRFARDMESVERYGNKLAGKMAREKDPEVRAALASLLGKAGPKNARSLERALLSRHADAREAAARALVRVARDPVAIARDNLGKESTRRKQGALSACPFPRRTRTVVDAGRRSCTPIA